MVDMQFTVLALSLTALALVPVPEQHVFPNIPESELFTLLVVGALRQRKPLFLGLQQLGIELRSFHGYLTDRQELAYLPNPVDMGIHFLPYGRRNPSRLLGPGPVQEPGLAVAGFPVPSGPAELPSRG